MVTAWLSKQAVLRFFSFRKINNFLFFIGGEKPEIGIRLLLVKENNSNAVHLVHHYSKPDPKPISDITYHQKKTTPYKNINPFMGEIHNPSIWGNIHILTKRS